LELVQHAEGNELADERGDEFVANFGHLLAVTKLGKVVLGHAPPVGEHLAWAAMAREGPDRPPAWIDCCPGSNGRNEGQITGRSGWKREADWTPNLAKSD